MKKEFLIKSLNLSAAEALTLEKGEDRMEFQALLLNGLTGISYKPCELCQMYHEPDPEITAK